jgi:hypothetical protein
MIKPENSMSELDFLKSCEPPWVVFPAIQPEELSRYLKQGVTEAWFDQQWRPFWSRLPLEQQQKYLDHWHATAEWRKAITFYFGTDPAFDIEADARESEEYLKQWRKNQKK